MFIPYLVPDIQSKQKDALAYGVRGPLIYTNVAITNRRPFVKLGIEGVRSPTMYHESMGLTEAAELGALHPARTPDEPIAIHMTRVSCAPGKPRKEQHRIGRLDLDRTGSETSSAALAISWRAFWGPAASIPARHHRNHRQSMAPRLRLYVQQPVRPIEWVFTQSDSRPCVQARKPFGLIMIVNSEPSS